MLCIYSKETQPTQTVNIKWVQCRQKKLISYLACTLTDLYREKRHCCTGVGG